ncbi:hypothetical protein [Acinetobacter venetianus]|uniref:hypothetical protein n=1 Tax=Acinetobacter venetianus TaxID=52133 RepID=UPI0007782AA0|nr:hypothetical protein [Acinetobacter venetianus]KXZ65594.1 hypothetical protein AVENLUH7437_01371 [Acinetobacter venetianus]
MQAIQFIKDHGVKKAKEVVEGIPDKTASHYVISKRSHYYSVDFQSYFNNGDWYDSDYTSEQDLANDYEPQNVIRLNDLKRLVESITIVEDHGGLETIKKCVEKTIFPLSDRIIRMKQAIADYEAIYSNDCEILDHPEDYTPPNCKKFDERVK